MIEQASSVNPGVILIVLAIGAIGMYAAITIICSVCYAPSRPVVEESEIEKRIIR